MSIAEIQALVRKADFHGLESCVHLAAAGETPLLRSHATVLDWYAHEKARGMTGHDNLVEHANTVRREIADWLGVNDAEIGFGYNVAQVSNMVARAMDGMRGNVVMLATEYPSMMFPWTGPTRGPMEVRLVPDRGESSTIEDIAEFIDRETRAVIISHVSYYSGARQDLEQLRKLADSVGSLLIVDCSHSLGAFPVALECADFAFACCYKWVLGAHGVAVAYCNRTRQPEWLPREVGWASAEWQEMPERGGHLHMKMEGFQFELGNVSYLSVAMLGNAVRYLRQLNPRSVEEHILALSHRLREGVDGLGLHMLTPTAAPQRAGSVAFRVSDEERWSSQLHERGVLGWVNEGRVRLSSHIYNDSIDIDVAIEAVRAIAALNR